ncbi:MAG: hypothetical protein M1816_006535 [Peltula sp. TS41687]|nr:MAG: hypothetical protein M1816_006535 [Peltula sp. TS41687]
MVFQLTYRRPAYVNCPVSATWSTEEKVKSLDGSIKSGSTGMSNGIPDALSFDRIISGGTCPPCTIRDFMNYLIYREHSAENLQFFLWYRDYCKRFAEVPASERVLAPEWTSAQAAAAEAELAQLQTKGMKNLSPETTAIFKGTDFAPKSNNMTRTDTPPLTPNTINGDYFSARNSQAGGSQADAGLLGGKDYTQTAAKAFEGAGLKLQPFTVQPFRQEVDRVIATYLNERGPRELNISARERAAALHALARTTHPSAFQAIAATIECSLRYQAHPNFIRWVIYNGNHARVVFARGLGLGGILLGFIAAVLITLSHAGRGWRALAAIGWFIGVSTLFAAWKGLCVVLHGMHHRHLRPWELFAEDEEASAEYELGKESFDSGMSNSYEDQPWVIRYEKRNIVRKVFDREVWIQEPALRQIQDTIFLQAAGVALVASLVLSAIFVALPKGKLF